MKRPRSRLAAMLLSALSLAVTLHAQTPIDLERAAAELSKTLERPANTTIGAEQKAALDAFLERYKDADLGPLGYAKAMQRYLERDAEGAAKLLDAFFAEHKTIAHDEHRKVAGRIYLGAIAAAQRQPSIDEVQLRTRAETMARLYDSYQVVARVVAPLLEEGKLQEPAALRVALLRGACASGAEPQRIDEFARAVYGSVEAAAPARAAAPPAARAGSALVGKPAPAFTAKDVVRTSGAAEPLSLDKLAGRVVVLDFFASWCGPCRAALPHLVDLQAKHRADLQVVSLTRPYGHGMDFSGPDASTPHGGQKVENLSLADEIELNRGLARAFALEHPIAFVDAEVFQSYGVKGIPMLVVLDRAGVVVGEVIGNRPESLDQLVQQALTKK